MIDCKDLASAWNPGAPDPVVLPLSPAFWIADRELRSKKVFLFVVGEKFSMFLQQYDPATGMAHVAGHGSPVPLALLSPCHPSIPMQHVVAFEGEHKGQEFRVRTIVNGVCGLVDWKRTVARPKIKYYIPATSLVHMRD